MCCPACNKLHAKQGWMGQDRADCEEGGRGGEGRGGEGRGGQGRADCPDVSMGLALTTITLVTCHKHAVGLPHMA